MFATLFSRRVRRWRGAVATLACIGVYTLLVGAGASVVRAALMGGLTLFAAQLGRRQDGLNTLAIVALVMALLSVEPGAREGLPSPETLEAAQGYTLLRTDRKGWIEITTDGEQMWLEVERR